AVIAFKTYKSQAFLEYAKQVWWTAKEYTLSQTDVDLGTVPLKDFALNPTCLGITTAGGTFYRFSSVRSRLFTQLHLRIWPSLSTLLAEATGEDMYLEAAKQSADFIRNHLYNAQNVVQDGISVRANDSCSLNYESFQEPYNSGLMIEGLAILYSITQNASVHDMIEEILAAAIPYSGWQGSNGIMNAGDSYFHNILPRALSTVYARNATTPNLQSYIEAYLSVQFNAIIDLARTSESSIYGGSWNGPPSSSFDPGNQTRAIQTLIGVIN
ncbi:hypothetical protein B0H13DRAFT_1455483, partial [Mycena leptocephala]